MAAAAPSDQIRQMVNFILQEAHEKANEIRVKTEHDFNLEKQTLVHEAKLAVADEFLKKEKDREIAERITRSTELGACRVKTMTVRDALLQTLLDEASSKCAVVSAGRSGGAANSNYPQLLQKLIVQGLIQIDENDVVIYTRASDVSVVQGLLASAVKEYVDIIHRATGGVTLKPNVTVNPDRSRDLADSTAGGVLLTAREGLITCDNTLKSRLHLVYEELLPAIRAILFPEEAK